MMKLNDEMFKVWMMKMNKQKDIIRNAHKAGVNILAGTDTGVTNPFTFPGFSLHEELENLVECGLSNLEALQAATLLPAKYINAADSIGQVAAGYMADLVLLDANPLEVLEIHRKSLQWCQMAATSTGRRWMNCWRKQSMLPKKKMIEAYANQEYGENQKNSLYTFSFLHFSKWKCDGTV
jgi:predicted amidohydrolase